MTTWFTLAQAVGPTTTTGNTATAPAAGGATLTTTSAPASTSGPGPKKDEGIFGSFQPIITMGLIFVVLYFLLFRGKNKEEKQRKEMIKQMKKGDEVMTIGGLVGKIVEVKEDRVVIKIDESNNVKATYLKSAIQRVLVEEEKK